MNVPIKNIMKADTSKGVPVWTTCLDDIRCYADFYLAKRIAKKNKKYTDDEKRTKVIKYKEQMNEIVTLIKDNFTNKNELGTSTVLLSVACINFLGLSVSHKCCASFVKHVFFHKFAGVAYTGAQTQKVVTVTRETLIPAVLPFVLRDYDRIVSGYGIYAFMSNKKFDTAVTNIGDPAFEAAASFLYGKSFKNIAERVDELETKAKSATTAEEKKRITLEVMMMFMPARGDTLYHDYDMSAFIGKQKKPRTYALCTLSHSEADKIHGLKDQGIKLARTPILTIETQNNTLVSFKDAAPVLPFSVRRANAEGLVTTVYSADMRKRGRGYGGIECNVVNKAQKTSATSTPSTTSAPATTSPPGIYEVQRQEILALYNSIFDLFRKNGSPGDPMAVANLTTDEKSVKESFSKSKNIDEVLDNEVLYTSLSNLLGLYAVDKTDDEKKTINNLKDRMDAARGTRLANDFLTILSLFRNIESTMIMINMNHPAPTTISTKAPSKKKV